MKRIYILFLFLTFNVLFAQNNRQQNTNRLPDDPIIIDPEEPTDPTDPGLAGEVGETKGELSVSLAGAAMYNVSIMVPPGINGVEPKIGLSYNSQAGVGLAGFGWNISGLSSITRIPATIFHDGFNDPVDLDSNDRFALDGQRLILTGGTYGAVGSTYTTENFSNLKITLKSANSSFYNIENGSAIQIYSKLTFKVEYPDGSIAYYGNSLDSSTSVISGITSWENPQGLKVNYTYANSTEYLYVASIKYGSKASTTGINEIQFVYKDRINAEQSYTRTILINNNKLLSEIKVLGNNYGFRSYTLNYDITTGYELLRTIQEKSGINSSFLRPIYFTYDISTDNNTIQNIGGRNIYSDRFFRDFDIGDFDGNGTFDAINYWSYNNTLNFVNNFSDSVTLTEQNLSLSGLFVANPEAKFRAINNFEYGVTGVKKSNKSAICAVVMDKIQQKIYFKIFTKNSSGLVLNETKELDETGTDFSSYQYYSASSFWKFGDFNGDGISDFIHYNSQLKKIKFVNLDNRMTTNYVVNLGTLDLEKYREVRYGDFNGDGKTDFIVISSSGDYSKLTLYTLDKTNTSIEKLLEMNIESIYPKNNPPYGRTILQGDFNGDGKLDLWFTKAKQILYYTANTFTMETDNAVMPDDDNTYAITADIDKDNKTDVVIVSKKLTYVSSHTAYACDFGPMSIEYYQQNCPYTYTVDKYSYDVQINTLIRRGKSWRSNQYTYLTGGVEYSNQQPSSLSPIFVDINKNSQKNTLTLCSGSNYLRYLDLSKLYSEKTLVSVERNNKIQNITYKKLSDTNVYISVTATEDFPNYDMPSVDTYKVVSKISDNSSGTIKTQEFKYYGGVSNLEGLGFLGFKGVSRTNWHSSSSQIISNISKIDISKRGAVIDNFSVLGDINPDFNLTVGTPFISRTQTFYNNEDTVYENPLLSNKVYNLKATLIKNFNGLESTSIETAKKYNVYNSIVEVTTNYKNGATTDKTVVVNNVYSGVSSNPYMVDKLTQSNSLSTVFPSGDTFSTEEQYSYNVNLLTQIKKKGDGTDYITEDNQYDPFGNIKTKTISASGVATRVNSFEYDASGRFLTKKTDIEGFITNYTYNNFGLLLTESFPTLTTTSLKNQYTYDAWGKLISKKDFYNKITTYAYQNTFDGGYSKETTYPSGAYSKITYNLLGLEVRNEVKDINGNLSFVDTNYDIDNKIIYKSQPHNGVANVWNEIQYDAYGRVTQTSNLKSGASPGKVTVYNYPLGTTTVTENDGVKFKTTTKNSLDQIISLTETPGGTINYSYFANGNLKSTNCNGATILIIQDGWGRKKELNDPSAGNRKYEYNNYGELTKEEVVGKGEIIYTLSGVGKLLTKTIKDPSGGVKSLSTYTYDPTNKLIKTIRLDDYANSTFSTNSFQYNSFNNVIKDSEELSGKAKFEKSISYDSFGRKSNTIYTVENSLDNKKSTKSITHTYKNGFEWQLIDDATGLPIWETKTTNPNGQILTVSLGNGINITNAYDIYGFPTQNKHDKSSTNIMTLNNTFDPVSGNLTYRSNNMFGSWDETLAYDNADRLTSYKDGLNYQTQSYNNNGTISNNAIGSYAYRNSAKPYQTTSVTPLNQDLAQGYLAYYGARTQNITYNIFKAPEKIDEASKEIIDFEYNAFNNRSVMYYGSLDPNKVSRPYKKYYSADGSMEIRIKTSAPASIELVTYIGGNAYNAPAFVSSDGTTQKTYYFHKDYQGTIVGISDNLGAIVEKRVFDVWGEMIKYQKGVTTTIPVDTGTMLSDRGYTGHEHLQGVNLINMNGRIYDFKFHRFLQPDNNIQDPYNTQNYNRYAYVMNNPTRYTDESGETWGAFFGWLAGAIFSTYVHGGQATGNPNPLEWNAGQWGSAVSSAVAPTVFSYASNAATDSVNGYITSYGQPTAAQQEYMNNNPIVNVAESHGYVNNDGSYLNEAAFVKGLRDQNSASMFYPKFGKFYNPFLGLNYGERCGDCIDSSTIGRNFFGLTYPGGDNPMSLNEKYSYSYVPKFASEYPAIGHDRRYDNLEVAGASGLFTDTRAIGADYEFVRQELSIAANPTINPLDRFYAAVLGGGLGFAASFKTVYHYVSLGSSKFYVDVATWYSISSQGVDNKPSIHNH